MNIGDKRKCVHCGGEQVLCIFDLIYNIWKCTNKKCRKENLELIKGGK
jgi:hypothetical protein